MEYVFSNLTHGLKSSAVREILKLTQGNSIISLAGGLPAEEHFPIEAIRQAFGRVLDKGKSSLQYNLTEGYRPLRVAIAERMKDKNIHIDANHMLLTTGSQQAIDLLVKVYVNPGEVVLVENPTYLAVLQVFNSYGIRVIAVDADENGMILNDLQHKLALHRPKMIYVTPTFANPTGKVWSLERRLGVLELCKNSNTLILEDDPYGEIQFEQNVKYPSIFSLDTHPDDCAVVYTSTFSKTVAPALRTGWVMGDQHVISQMTRAKQASDLHSSSMDQQALYQLLQHFDLNEHIQMIRHEYYKRMQLMKELLVQPAFTGMQWTEPKGGMFFWVGLPDGMNSELLLKKCVELGVAFVPGAVFYAENPKVNMMRLNFTHTDREKMIIGMNRLGEAVTALKAEADLLV